MKRKLILLAMCLLVAACSRSATAPDAPTATRDDRATAVVPSPEETPIPEAVSEPEEARPTDTPLAEPPEAEPATPVPIARSPVDEILVSLEGLPLEEFYDASFRELTKRKPETVTEAGLAAAYGMRNDQLNDLSYEYTRDTQALEEGVLDLLRTFDRDALGPEQRVSFDVYEWYLQNQVDGHAFAFHEYTLHHFIRSHHFNLDALFSEVQPLETKQDVEDYIGRLSQVLRQTEQVMERLETQYALGILPPRFIIRLARSDIYDYLELRSPDLSALEPESLVMYSRLDQSLDEQPELSAQEREEFRAQALQEIRSSVIPSYALMIEYLDRVESLATDEAGVWKLPDGERYYTRMLRQETSSDLTPEEVHALGQAEVERIRAEMGAALVEMGYQEGALLERNLRQAVDDAGYYSISSESGREAYVEAIEGAIAEAEERVAAVFDLKPHYQVTVIAGEYGGYYVPGSADGSRLGSYHVSTRGQWRPKYSLHTVAYHETTPGHHYQIATAQALDLPAFRKHLVFNAYVEGWALYAERLAWELGLYEGNPYGNIGRLQYELLRAVRLVTDTGIHAMGWSREEAQKYVDQATALPGWFSHEVDRYVVLPAQATGYKVGMLKILELRGRAEEALGNQFDLKEFHNVVIGNGSLPLEILDRVVQDWIDRSLKS